MIHVNMLFAIATLFLPSLAVTSYVTLVPRADLTSIIITNLTHLRNDTILLNTALNHFAYDHKPTFGEWISLQRQSDIINADIVQTTKTANTTDVATTAESTQIYNYVYNNTCPAFAQVCQNFINHYPGLSDYKAPFKNDLTQTRDNLKILLDALTKKATGQAKTNWPKLEASCLTPFNTAIAKYSSTTKLLLPRADLTQQIISNLTNVRTDIINLNTTLNQYKNDATLTQQQYIVIQGQFDKIEQDVVATTKTVNSTDVGTAAESTQVYNYVNDNICPAITQLAKNFEAHYQAFAKSGLKTPVKNALTQLRDNLQILIDALTRKASGQAKNDYVNSSRSCAQTLSYVISKYSGSTKLLLPRADLTQAILTNLTKFREDLITLNNTITNYCGSGGNATLTGQQYIIIQGQFDKFEQDIVGTTKNANATDVMSSSESTQVYNYTNDKIYPVVASLCQNIIRCRQCFINSGIKTWIKNDLTQFRDNIKILFDALIKKATGQAKTDGATLTRKINSVIDNAISNFI